MQQQQLSREEKAVSRGRPAWAEGWRAVSGTKVLFRGWPLARAACTLSSALSLRAPAVLAPG